MYRIESLLSARLFLQPSLANDRIYFVSNLGGRLSLYVMDRGGSVPEPLLPPNIALQNPHLIGGKTFCVFQDLDTILVMMDQDGDENYQPMLIPLSGGYPSPAFDNALAGYRVHLTRCDADQGIANFIAESRSEPVQDTFQGNLTTGELMRIASSTYGMTPTGANEDHTKVALVEGYTTGDEVLYLWDKTLGETKLLFGVPLEKRDELQKYAMKAIFDVRFTPDNKGLLAISSAFTDTYGLSYLDPAKPQGMKPVEVIGARHAGQGELVGVDHLTGNRYMVEYNIDGVSWLYEGRFDATGLVIWLENVICGEGDLANGVLESTSYNADLDEFILAFSSATSPTQIYTISGEDRKQIAAHTRERVLGIPSNLLSNGEDASFVSFDDTRISARLYLPSESLGFSGPRPVVYYVHGGPQGQERPDFAWFSMPLIQFLTLNGFAVFVPNVRGSTGYGLKYTKQVDHDWGGQDRFDHVHAMKMLAADPRLDTKRAGVVGRSYGGYMTLTLASRHPELWLAAVDMFGPYDLVTFSERIPPTWKPYFELALGHPERDRDFLVERSPKTYIDQITCPLLVIQGKNDPRVVERESSDLVQRMGENGQKVEYLMFENEGHDVLKFENRVVVYNRITDFFKHHLCSEQ